MKLTQQFCLPVFSGRCEVCKTKFRFDPQYAENAPDRLPAHEVVLGLCSRFVAKWLPLALRILLAATLWLVVAPFLTSCLYHGWMHRPSSILTRWSRELIPGDIVSGAIIVAIIIISFLSMMSFADFLRVHWGEPENEAQRRRDGHANDFPENNREVEDDEGGIDETILDIMEGHEQSCRSNLNSSRSQEEGQETLLQEGARQQLESSIRGALQHAGAESPGHRQERDPYDSESDSDENEEEGFAGFDIYDAEFEEDGDEEPQAGANGNDVAQPQNGARNRNRQFDPMDPLQQDDQVVSFIESICERRTVLGFTLGANRVFSGHGNQCGSRRAPWVARAT